MAAAPSVARRCAKGTGVKAHWIRDLDQRPGSETWIRALAAEHWLQSTGCRALDEEGDG
jgi:hypothetical protein